MSRHPDDVLFDEDKPLPAMPAVDHYAGSEKLMRKALQLQTELGPVFDLTCDCEDGARTGAEAEHAHMVCEVVNAEDNRWGRVGVRIHDISHAHWRKDLEILIAGVGKRLAFVTLPKVRSAADVQEQIAELRRQERQHDTGRSLPVHVLIETHGALREVWEIAATEGVESLDFGLMDFVSAHQGAIMGSAMSSPGQFTHPLIVRAKTEIVAAALANGVMPSHNVTTELQDVARIRADADTARLQFGFLRMWSIHPRQIEPIVQAMQPDFSEVHLAGEILLKAQDADWGPVSHQCLLHDRASYRYYWNVLRRAQAVGMHLDAPLVERFFPASNT